MYEGRPEANPVVGCCLEGETIRERSGLRKTIAIGERFQVRVSSSNKVSLGRVDLKSLVPV